MRRIVQFKFGFVMEKDTFHDRVIPTVGSSRHAGDEFQFLRLLMVKVGSELAALVCVKQDAGHFLHSAFRQGHNNHFPGKETILQNFDNTLQLNAVRHPCLETQLS